jgi:hypothetical protein
MTQDHLTDEQITAYRRRDLDESHVSAVAAHLSACVSCLERVVDPAHAGVAFASLKESFFSRVDEEPFHISRKELHNYINGEVDEADRTIFKSHLADCGECSEVFLALLHAPSSVPFTIENGKVRLPRQSRWPRFVESFRASRSMRPLYLGLLAVVLVSATLLILLLRNRGSNLANKATPEVANRDTANRSQPVPASPNNQVESPPNLEAGGHQKQTNESGTPEPPNRSADIVVSLVDGSGTVELDSQGRLSGLDSVPKPIQEVVRHALATGGIDAPSVVMELKSQGITLLGQPSPSIPIPLLAPVGVARLDDHPTFTWQRLAGATNYTVSIFDSNFNRVASSGPQAAYSWTVPSSLARGKKYFWEVSALLDGREITTSPVAPAPRAQFVIVDRKAAVEIDQLRKSNPNSRLALGIAYARAGLLDDAEREFESLAAANPNSEVVKSLLARVKGWKSR